MQAVADDLHAADGWAAAALPWTRHRLAHASPSAAVTRLLKGVSPRPGRQHLVAVNRCDMGQSDQHW